MVLGLSVFFRLSYHNLGQFPLRVLQIPGEHTLQLLSRLHDVIDLDKVIVISGFGTLLRGLSRHEDWRPCR